MGEGRQAGLKGAEFLFIRRFGKQNDKGRVEKKGGEKRSERKSIRNAIKGFKRETIFASFCRLAFTEEKSSTLSPPVESQIQSPEPHFGASIERREK
jgi:hypothetical protein